MWAQEADSKNNCESPTQAASPLSIRRTCLQQCGAEGSDKGKNESGLKQRENVRWKEMETPGFKAEINKLKATEEEIKAGKTKEEGTMKDSQVTMKTGSSLSALAVPLQQSLP